jgi:penicillin-binding protein 1A
VSACAVGLTALVVAAVWRWYAGQLPSVETLAVYEPPVATIVRDEAGREVGEFFKEQRYVVPLDGMPQHLADAFVAAEDAAFWEHNGLDYEGIARAFWQNLRQGRLAQGGSTITQQVARSFLLSRDKTLDRKLREALLSQRIESSFPKEHILYLYLNQLFLGHGAYGGGAAARLYFGKESSELTLAESALLAGLPQAPSRYSPNKNYKAAKARQRYVLREMLDRGFITAAEAHAALSEELVFREKTDRNQLLAPHYVEHVRRYLYAQAREADEQRARRPTEASSHPYDGLHPLTSGLTVVIPIDLALQAAAKEALSRGVARSDRLMGWRGPLRTLASEEERAAARDAVDRERVLTLFA